MANFDTALKITLECEGGLVNEKDDPGGITNYGISLRFLEQTGLKYDFNHDGKISEQEIIKLTPEEVSTIYRDEFWNPANLSDVVNQGIANYLFDICVNNGHMHMTDMLNDALKKTYDLPSKLEEGWRKDVNCFVLKCNLVNARVAHYKWLAEMKPRDSKYIEGWLNRAESIRFWE